MRANGQPNESQKKAAVNLSTSGSAGPRGAAGNGVGRAKPASVVAVKGSSPLKLVVHLVIILLLILAIRVVWNAYVEKKSRYQNTEQVVSENSQVMVVNEVRPKAGSVVKPSSEAHIDIDGVDDFSSGADPLILPKENIAQVMAELRGDLVRGSRSKMPQGTFKKGGNYFYHVDLPMTWIRAFWYAQQHGGHLAIPGSRATAAWMRDELADDDDAPFWVGAAKSGRDAWTLADGRAWQPKDPDVRAGDCVAVDAAGELLGLQGSAEHSFVIQWTSDGSNPGAIDNLLKITMNSLATSIPIYPPGTRSYGMRNYLYVPQVIDWKNAVLGARASGGHLMVVGEIVEAFNLEKMTKDVVAEDGIWLGGFHMPGKGWRWTTGEQWRSTRWPQSKPTKIADAALLIEPSGDWGQRSRDGVASGYIIEWSPDAKKVTNR